MFAFSSASRESNICGGQPLQSIVTVDDVLHATRQRADRDLQRAGGMEALEVPYLESSFGRLLRKRAGWLSVLFVGEMLTATAMSFS